MSKRGKGPVTQEVIFKIMMGMTFGVASMFLLKNIISKSIQGIIVIGVCLLVFACIAGIMKGFEVSRYKQQFIMSMCLIVLVFVISINSGDYYSDDFLLLMAIIGLTGLYLEPQYTKYQIVFMTLVLIILYKINPQKADPLPQYSMCVILFDIAAYIIYLVIRRGKAFIEISNLRAEQAEKLLKSIKQAGEELKGNYENSYARIDGMKEVNERLEKDALDLKKGSAEISQETHEVELTCAEAQKSMQATEGKIEDLNIKVKKVEEALTQSKESMQAMDLQMSSVKSTITSTNEVFSSLKSQIQKVANATKKLTVISANTKMVALNASIEATKAGEAGSGFAVVASKVENLAADSNSCSELVVDVVGNMKKQIDNTAQQLQQREEEINNSLEALSNMEEVFKALVKDFEELYKNIGEQNENVTNVDYVFGELKNKIGEMSSYSKENQTVVKSIISSMEAYKTHMNLIIDDTKQIHELSAAMLEESSQEK